MPNKKWHKLSYQNKVFLTFISYFSSTFNAKEHCSVNIEFKKGKHFERKFCKIFQGPGQNRFLRNKFYFQMRSYFYMNCYLAQHYIESTYLLSPSNCMIFCCNFFLCSVLFLPAEHRSYKTQGGCSTGSWNRL